MTGSKRVYIVLHFIPYRRRYFPLELLYNILDGMSSVKLNVFHFHFVDFCRFSVESKL